MRRDGVRPAGSRHSACETTSHSFPPRHATAQRAARRLDAAAAILATGVLTDSASEHYRAGFHNRAMFIAPAVSAAALTTATASAFTRRAHGSLPRIVFAASVATGVVG